ncbi:specifically androgen-regulated gene protein [Xyrichtys novacula]|nr:specifically androgen-regulated gene protein [Xyrichtys novacula]
MPKSDTWPGGVGLEAMTGVDSAGSCDSVVSANSGFSDDSMEHLSAEEKACLMFLEETIESLDTEEDSGLSNDEPDQLPSPGNLATKLADLSASMNRNKLSNSPKKASKETPRKENGDVKIMQSYLVPTPLIMAGSSPSTEPRVNPGVPKDRNLTSKSQVTSSSKELVHKDAQKPVAPQLPLEINVVISPSNKPVERPVKTPEGPLPRGPLSYEALFYLRRTASTKKTPLCPTIDHTIESDKQRPATAEGQNQNPTKSVRFHPEVSISRTSPPVVAPKPPKIPGNVSVKTQKQPFVKDSLFNMKHATDPEVVRMEALQKLGLLKDQENTRGAALSAPQSFSTLNRTSHGFTGGPSPSRSPSFSQVNVEPKTKPLQSSASFHHPPRTDQQPVFVSNPPQSTGVKAAGLVRSNTLGNHRFAGNDPELPHNTKSTSAQSSPSKSSNTVPYTVMMVPGMGVDRREALRKLGLLKI